MNIIMIRLKNGTDVFTLLLTKNCETLIEHRRPGEILEFKLNKARETLHFDPLISIEGS